MTAPSTCSKCGAAFAGDERFCSSCGTARGVAAATVKAKTGRSRGWWQPWAAVGAALVFISIAGAVGEGRKNEVTPAVDDLMKSAAVATSGPGSTSATAASTPRSTSTPTATAATGEKLALLSASCTSSVGYSRCSGSVKNLTDKPMRSVAVVISWVDANGVIQTADDSLIDYNPILPGQESPWDTIGQDNPALTRFRVSFKELLGGTISMRDDRR